MLGLMSGGGGNPEIIALGSRITTRENHYTINYTGTFGGGGAGEELSFEELGYNK